MARKVTQIPATRALHTGTSLTETKARRVAGYARVSTDHDDQVTSYHAQVDYYTPIHHQPRRMAAGEGLHR